MLKSTLSRSKSVTLTSTSTQAHWPTWMPEVASTTHLMSMTGHALSRCRIQHWTSICHFWSKELHSDFIKVEELRAQIIWAKLHKRFKLHRKNSSEKPRIKKKFSSILTLDLKQGWSQEPLNIRSALRTTGNQRHMLSRCTKYNGIRSWTDISICMASTKLEGWFSTT